MTTPPKWYMPATIVALLWNLLGCAAYLSDVMLSPEDIAGMDPAMQEMYAARTAWMVSATAIAVWGGALGCLGLVLRKRWANWLFVASLAGIVVQDVGLFVVTGSGAAAGAAAMLLQGLVLVVGIALVMLGRRAAAEGWIS